MSSTTPISLKMQVVVSSLDETQVFAIQKELLAFCPDLSFSPLREQPSLVDCIEFFATAKIDEETKALLVKSLDNDWDHDEDESEYWAYGFNTKMFNPIVYYLQMEFTKLHG